MARPAAEISGDGRVLTADGRDVTDAYRVGARKAVELANERGVVGAVLKARSPSCGPHDVYDGTHSGTLVQGQGVTAAALGAVGYRVLDEDDVANGRLPDPDR